jgi:hypothetical protein
LGFHGLLYTWDNRQTGSRNVKARLDRALGDEAFLNRLGESEVYHIPLVESDHCGLLVEVRERVAGGRLGGGRKKVKPFRYENMWRSHGEYMDFVTRTWDLGDGDMDLTAVAGALSSLQTSLKTWDKEVFGSIKQQVKKLGEDLEVERARSLYRGPSSAEKSIMDRLAIIVSREETMEK